MADNTDPPAKACTNDSIGKTLVVVLLLCLVCSIIVAGAAVGLKQIQQQQQQLDQYRNILQVADVLSSTTLSKKMSAKQIVTIFKQNIAPCLIDLASGEFIAGDANQFDPTTAEKDPNQSSMLSASVDSAHIRRRANVQRVYLVRQQPLTFSDLDVSALDVNNIPAFSTIVLPVHGNGLWSMMYAFVAVKNDGNTIQGISYYQQGETPGLGGEVENFTWRQQWIGKQLFNTHGKPAIHLVKGGAKPGDVHAIDALSGATLTTKGVQGTFDFWLGPLGYGPFLAKVRTGVRPA